MTNTTIKTTQELKNRLNEIVEGFNKRIYFFGTAEGDEALAIESELVKRGEITATATYNDD